ncbi:PAS domain S-box protein [Devosia sp. SL43]|uniref:PAS domain S-box protein n=1 Tax=Devosia sp. SL43 TaxID=2806348 RepID=UPI001F48A50D|nr:PAS domain S-box protein [Devosia sp. SL43]UJW86767.1 PAS domain S-box protein [Devosia sp. SL43]
MWDFALEGTGQGTWDCDVRANKVHYSRFWKQMRGYEPNEEVDSAFDAWLGRVHPDDRDRVLDEMRKQDSQGLWINAFEYRERHKSGHYIWILSLGSAVEWSDDGKPSRVIGTDTDITDRKNADLEAMQLSRRLELALDSSRDGVVILDLQTLAVVQTNRAFGELLQRDVDEVVGMYPWDWDARTSKLDIIAFLQGAGQSFGNQTSIFETLLRRKDGSLIEIEVNLSCFETGGKHFAYSTIRDVTERNLVNGALHEATELKRVAVEASRQGIVLIEMNDLVVVQANRAFAEMLGLEPSAVIGLHPWEWDADPDENALRILFAQKAASGLNQPLLGSRVFRRKDGQLIDVDIDASIIEVGDKRYCHAVLSDVTANKAAELALRQSEAKFRAMFESTRRLIALLEPDGRNIETNPRGYTFTGLTPEQTRQLHFWEGHWWLNDVDRARVQDTVHRAAAGEYVQLQIGQRSAAGTTHTSDLSITPIFGSDGEVVQLMVEATDITALEQAKTELEQSERRWNYALESAGQGVWEWNLGRPQTQGTARWKQMRGYAPDEPIEFSYEAWLDRLHPDDRARVRDVIERQGSGAQDYNGFEYRERHKDGHYIWISSVGAAVEWDSNGTATRRIGTDTDITERKVAEQKVLDLSRRLELALEASRLGVFEAKQHADEIHWNDRLYEVSGVPRNRSPLRVADFIEALHPDDVAKVLEGPRRAQVDGSFESEFRFVRPDGEVRTVRSRGALFEDQHAGPRVIGVIWDVTEEVALTQGLYAAKELAEARNVELEVAKERIETQSLHDALTGLPNRRYLDEVLEHHASQSRLSSGGMALLHIDLDGFKQINDTLGHIAGDAMLVHVADLLRNCIGPDQFAARVGGDEFVVAWIGELETERLQTLANTIIDRIRQPVPYQGHLCRFGASIGIAVEAGGEFNAQRVLINADVALYQAKGRGRNRHEFFSEALQEEISSNKRIADDILRGIEQNEFIPHYQPLVDARTLDIVGVEALLRWNHPTDGLIAPFRFLKIAENLDVLRIIDQQVLLQAIRDMEHWHAAGLDIPSVSVNVTFQRLNDENLISGLRDLNIKPGTISFEFLESIFLDECDSAIARNIAGLRELGISFDVDDFGTGHTSIVSLLKLSPRRFKIDRQLVDPVVRGPEHRRLVASIVDIGKSLGIGVVAEGVETMEHARILADLGCDYLQGYAFARPMPADQIAGWVATSTLRRAS